MPAIVERFDLELKFDGTRWVMVGVACGDGWGGVDGDGNGSDAEAVGSCMGERIVRACGVSFR